MKQWITFCFFSERLTSDPLFYFHNLSFCIPLARLVLTCNTSCICRSKLLVRLWLHSRLWRTIFDLQKWNRLTCRSFGGRKGREGTHLQPVSQAPGKKKNRGKIYHWSEKGNLVRYFQILHIVALKKKKRDFKTELTTKWLDIIRGWESCHVRPTVWLEPDI